MSALQIVFVIGLTFIATNVIYVLASLPRKKNEDKKMARQISDFYKMLRSQFLLSCFRVVNGEKSIDEVYQNTLAINKKNERRYR